MTSNGQKNFAKENQVKNSNFLTVSYYKAAVMEAVCGIGFLIGKLINGQNGE